MEKVPEFSELKQTLLTQWRNAKCEIVLGHLTK